MCIRDSFWIDEEDRSELYDFVLDPQSRLFDFQADAITTALQCLTKGPRAGRSGSRARSSSSHYGSGSENHQHNQQQPESFCLALDAGLGKTLCTTKIIEGYLACKPKGKVIVVCPGGLARQLSDGLVSYPWRASSKLAGKVVSASTGAELAALLAEEEEPTKKRRRLAEKSKASKASSSASSSWCVLVVNKALRWLACVESFDLVVVDEAHCISAATARILSSKLLLALSATPHDANNMLAALNIHRAVRSDRVRLFNVRKTERLVGTVGTARTTLGRRLVPLADPQGYWTRLAVWAAGNYLGSSISRLVLFLTLERAARTLPEEAELAVVASSAFPVEVMHLLLTKAVAQSGNVMLQGVTRFHGPMAARLLAARRIHRRVTDFWAARGRSEAPRFADDEHARAFASSAALELAGGAGVNECSCCELTAGELQQLHHVHACVTPEPDLSASFRHHDHSLDYSLNSNPRGGGGGGVGGATSSQGLPLCGAASAASAHPRFTSAVVRCGSALEARAQAEHFAGDTAAVSVQLLCSSMSASQRAAAVKRFCSFDGLRCAVAVFKRGMCRVKDDPLREAVFQGVFGQQVLARITELLVSRRLLICDATVDVGFDLHRHCDAMVIPRMIATRSQFLQLVGRVSRIATEREDQGVVELQTASIVGSLDQIFERHVQSGGPVPHPGGCSLVCRRHEVMETMMSQIAMRLADDEVLCEWFEQQVRTRLRMLP